MIRGIDVSSVQGVVPYASLSQDIRFVIAKCQQGNDGKDPLFEANVRAATDHGLITGAYHFAYPLPHLDPRAQAEKFFEASRGHGTNKGELPPFLDAEWPEPSVKQPDGTVKLPWKKWGCSSQQISDWLAACCERMHELWTVRPIIYTYPWWWAEVSKGVDVSWAKQYKLWIASYTTQGKWPTEGQKPSLPKPWDDYLFWQFDGNGGLRFPNGVDADFNVFNGTEIDLQILTQEIEKPPSSTQIFKPVLHLSSLRAQDSSDTQDPADSDPCHKD